VRNLKSERDGQRMDRKPVSENAKRARQHNAHDQYGDHVWILAQIDSVTTAISWQM
jgi:hypothetical protein